MFTKDYFLTTAQVSPFLPSIPCSPLSPLGPACPSGPVNPVAPGGPSKPPGPILPCRKNKCSYTSLITFLLQEFCFCFDRLSFVFEFSN